MSVDLHCGFSVGQEVTEPLRIRNREYFINCSDEQVCPAGTVKCLAVVKEGQDGLLRLGGLISETDRPREDLVFAKSILTEARLFRAEEVPDFCQEVTAVTDG